MQDSDEQRLACALCGRAIAVGDGFVVRIDVFADPQIPPMDAAQVASANFDQTLGELMQQIEQMSAEELQDGVHRRFECRLCASCQRAYISNPLGMPRRAKVGQN